MKGIEHSYSSCGIFSAIQALCTTSCQCVQIGQAVKRMPQNRFMFKLKPDNELRTLV